MSANVCHYCGPTDEELRPYGPGGAPICFPCMKAKPEREKAARAELGRRFDKAGPVAVLTPDGPKPFPRRRRGPFVR